MSADKLNSFENLFLCKSLCMAENDSACAFDLIVEKLAEVLHIHLALLRINNSSCGVEHDIGKLEILNSLDNVGKLADAGGLDDDPLGRICFNNLLKSLAEIADKRAADAAGVHFRDLNACLLEKASVDTDIAELIFNNNELFTCKCFAYKLFDKSSLSRTEKA